MSNLIAQNAIPAARKIGKTEPVGKRLGDTP
jgi:hypothetical protein